MYFTFVRIHQQRAYCQSLKAKKLGRRHQLQGMRGIHVPDVLEIYQMIDTRLTASFQDSLDKPVAGGSLA